VVGRRLVVAALLFLSSVLVFGGEGIANWSAPATWSPARGSGGMTVQDVTPPLPFIGVTPCRIADTRGNGFTGAYGPPALSAGSPRNFTLAGRCGIPAGAGAVSLNITVINTAGAGFIKIFPQGGASPVVSTLNYVAGQTVANAAVVPLSAGGAVTVAAGVSGTDLILDTNGYYASAAANQSNTFTVINSGGTTIPAILGQTNSSLLNATGVKGVATTGVTNGVWGDNLSTSDGATGVFGFAEGTSGITTGVWGRTVSFSDDSRGVYGEALVDGGKVYGVYGYESSIGRDAAGVRGVDSSGVPPGSFYYPAGVRGESDLNYGVFGLSRAGFGVAGRLVDSTGLTLSTGYLGYASSVGVYYDNGLAGTGTKSFVEPHPTDPSKAIRYVCLEGPEAGTYFRGTDQTSHGTSVIQVPESFRLVSDAEGLTVQLTPVGAAATMYVVSQDLNQIVVRSSRDVKFHYMVNGVRKAYPHWDAIQENKRFFVPESASERLPPYLTEEERGRLIRNGTYNGDGTVNMETAERLGWTKMWADREQQAKAAAARSPAERRRD
jgi:hypothetical protein